MTRAELAGGVLACAATAVAAVLADRFGADPSRGRVVSHQDKATP